MKAFAIVSIVAGLLFGALAFRSFGLLAGIGGMVVGGIAALFLCLNVGRVIEIICVELLRFFRRK